MDSEPRIRGLTTSRTSSSAAATSNPASETSDSPDLSLLARTMSAFVDTNAANSTPARLGNRSQQAEQRTVVKTLPTTLDYIVNGKRAHISNQQYECYEHIWRQLPHPVLGAVDVEGKASRNCTDRLKSWLIKI